MARAGLDPAKTAQAADMQRALSVNPDLPKERRPADETIIKLHGIPRARSSNSGMGAGPESPGNGTKAPKAASKVVPIRSEP